MGAPAKSPLYPIESQAWATGPEHQRRVDQFQKDLGQKRQAHTSNTGEKHGHALLDRVLYWLLHTILYHTVLVL